MAISLFDATIGAYKQILTSTAGFLEKGRAHCEANGQDVNALVQSKVAEDMFPLHFQVVSIAHHSIGALRGIQKGIVGIPPSDTYDYAGLQGLINDTLAAVNAITPDQVNALADNDMLFKMGDFELPFTVQGFLLSFSLPNFYFHASMAYAILRMNGVAVGKADFLGAMQLRGA